MRPLRILLSEGSSTSAREAITALGLNGHRLEICDPDAHCLGRFSRFVTRFHRCPGLGTDPEGFRDFIVARLEAERYDVLLPTHEQGFLFAKIADRLTPLAGLAVPDFETYRRVHSKVGFDAVLQELNLGRPRAAVIADREALRSIALPAVVKMPIGTASRGVWLLHTPDDRSAAIGELDALGASAGPLLVQQFVDGAIEHAQAVFAHGAMLGCHQYRQIVRGLGGGEALKESVVGDAVRADMGRLGSALRWHGALSLDYIVPPDGVPLYIDCNPRLVEPMSARLAGLDLAELLVRVSMGERPAVQPPSRGGVRTRLALQGILGAAARTGSRRAVLREAFALARKSGIYAGAAEELTPLRTDPPSALPLAGALAMTIADPGAAARLAAKGWGAHLLDAAAAARIAAW